MSRPQIRATPPRPPPPLPVNRGSERLSNALARGSCGCVCVLRGYEKGVLFILLSPPPLKCISMFLQSRESVLRFRCIAVVRASGVVSLQQGHFTQKHSTRGLPSHSYLSSLRLWVLFSFVHLFLPAFLKPRSGQLPEPVLPKLTTHTGSSCGCEQQLCVPLFCACSEELIFMMFDARTDNNGRKQFVHAPEPLQTAAHRKAEDRND